MFSYLAYAEADDVSGSALTYVVITGSLVVLFGLMALVPCRTARIRAVRQSQTITALTVLWALLAVGITSYTIRAQMTWEADYQTNIKSGYFDPADVSDKPSLPWLSWSVLAAAYAGLTCWTLMAAAARPTAGTR